MVDSDNTSSNNQIRKNYQINTPVFKTNAFFSTNGYGVKAESSLGGLAGISWNGNVNVKDLLHSSVSIRLHENVNLNNNTTSIGGGIKPIGMLTAAAIVITRFATRVVPEPIFQNTPSLVPPTTMSTTK